jgi:hypothetical protein
MHAILPFTLFLRLVLVTGAYAAGPGRDLIDDVFKVGKSVAEAPYS